jgi:nitrous oxidase accessory protein
MKALCAALFVCLHISVLFARNWPVTAQAPRGTLARTVAQAAHGDTVTVHPGTYQEGNLVINKSITLIGTGWPVLDGGHKVEVITVRAANVCVQGFVLQNSGYGSLVDYAAVKVIEARGVRIIGNRLRQNFFGVYCANSTDLLIADNDIRTQYQTESQSGNGIHLWKCARASIRGNYINGHRDGIYFEFVSASVIDSNTSEANMRYGLHFMFSNNDQYVRNRFAENGAGVAVMYSKNVAMLGNSFKDHHGSGAYGLLLKDITDSAIGHNTFENNTTALYMEGSNRVQVRNNNFIKNGWALRLLADCSADTFTYNNFTANTFDVSTNGQLVLNFLYRNYWDKYQGYDLDRNQLGDVPYHPVSLYAMIIEQIPSAIILARSMFVTLLDQAEKALPSLTPQLLADNEPLMQPAQPL